jgi:hypothetical protein
MRETQSLRRLVTCRRSCRRQMVCVYLGAEARVELAGKRLQCRTGGEVSKTFEVVKHDVEGEPRVDSKRRTMQA